VDETDSGESEAPASPGVTAEAPGSDGPSAEPTAVGSDGRARGSGSSSSEVDPAVRAGFWRLVLVVDAGIAGLTLGGLLVWFRADLLRGGALLAAGLAATGYAAFRYRELRRRLAGASEGDE